MKIKRVIDNKVYIFELTEKETKETVYDFLSNLIKPHLIKALENISTSNRNRNRNRNNNRRIERIKRD